MGSPFVNSYFCSSPFGSHVSESGATYPTPLEVIPLQSHKMTFVILHGRGDEAYPFGSVLLNTSVSPGESNTKIEDLRSVFPQAKFVFPTAARRRAQGSNRSMSNQWFDNYSPLSIEEQCRSEDWQIEGLRETCKFIHDLLRYEISIVGASNVILGGLSQGCATSLIASLLWDGPPLRAMIGMCGWLPLRKRMEDIATNVVPDCGVNFGNDEDTNAKVSHDGRTQALQYLHDQLDIPSKGNRPVQVFQQIPIFLGHGMLDLQVPLGLKREAARCLTVLGASVESQEYHDLGHWFSPQMLEDISRFVVSKRATS